MSSVEIGVLVFIVAASVICGCVLFKEGRRLHENGDW
jgi:hypothetical protein